MTEIETLNPLAFEISFSLSVTLVGLVNPLDKTPSSNLPYQVL